MSYLRQFENLVEVISLTGFLNGKAAQAFKIMGRRNGFTSVTLVNDVKEFDNAVAIEPILSASTLDIISSSANDTNTAGTGVRKVKVVYINNLNALVQSADINLNGVTLVTSVLTNVNAVLWMEATEVGSGLAAAGNIRLRINGGTVEVEQISLGNNKSLSGHFMVPTGYTAYLHNWKAHAINNDQQMRIVATVNSLDRSLSTVYHAQGNSSVASNTNSGLIYLPFLKLPALTRVKVNTISAGTALTVQADTSYVIVIIAD
jgi:hypothetical protein